MEEQLLSFIKYSQGLIRLYDQCSPKVTGANEQLSPSQEIFLLKPLPLEAD